ncbi:MAG: zinc ribbon domain-containing protein [Elusimicrobia bacterium]|nr:zinc ribbon domain-containing protein [Elusimicrobiota bacterium]
MECPKCKANNPDDAVFCSLCYENFKPKPKTAQAGGGSCVAFPSVVSTVEGFRITGPLVIREDGLYFFLKECERIQEGRLGTAVGGQMGGVVGHLIGAAINEAVDNMNEAERFRPPKLIFKPAYEIMESVQRALGDAPDIPSCKEFFIIERRDITHLEFGFLGGLTLKTKYLQMEVGGIDPAEKASGYFILRQYPFQR